MKKLLEIILIPLVILALFFVASGNLSKSKNNSNSQTKDNINNVSVIDGKQIIEIEARGGYSPRTSVAKAGIPTVIRFKTAGTFDCSSSVRIPSLNISQALPQTGSTDIDLGIPTAKTLSGSCGMGMYPFEIDFL